ncbi:unnamed protein product [Rotaria magnacalcarata]|uniref:Uncharacterized protein n=1 Tax=Rotaria magnacalcarata TaxID=392030 RepID=A0A815VJP2_9BILA|nr:unnamed protein product [Rotaria magnacalcarata]CAF1536108.1 unnamed protein product [Rotaria magnacalcarata]CAF2148761.1 unnamed protein product [Rotaria magnacalcarata]CAF4048191.1 unnamed protein product [Rotaria magnacalcarata]CAF4581139.1 unnamed protein product [Rotaria magnacalcarata]
MIRIFSRTSARTCQSIRVTRMLVLVSTCFLILKAPAHLGVIALKIYTSIDAPVFNDHSGIDLYSTTKKLTTCEVINYVWRSEINNLTQNDTVDFRFVEKFDTLFFPSFPFRRK